MKAYKSCIAIGICAVLAAANPIFGQDNDPAQSRVGQSSASQANEPVAPSGVQMNQPERDSIPMESSTKENSGVVMDEPAGASTDSRNWSWLGLLGLAGLFGLKRHHDVRDEKYRESRA